jgi:hypothetical protein
VARHIFQACPVWIYTQSNITQASYSPEYITPTQQISTICQSSKKTGGKRSTEVTILAIARVVIAMVIVWTSLLSCSYSVRIGQTKTHPPIT